MPHPALKETVLLHCDRPRLLALTTPSKNLPQSSIRRHLAYHRIYLVSGCLAAICFLTSLDLSWRGPMTFPEATLRYGGGRVR